MHACKCTCCSCGPFLLFGRPVGFVRPVRQSAQKPATGGGTTHAHCPICGRQRRMYPCARKHTTCTRVHTMTGLDSTRDGRRRGPAEGDSSDCQLQPQSDYSTEPLRAPSMHTPETSAGCCISRAVTAQPSHKYVCRTLCDRTNLPRELRAPFFTSASQPRANDHAPREREQGWAASARSYSLHPLSPRPSPSPPMPAALALGGSFIQ